ncbi:MAG TPA: succinate--CoA ligase subunit alpha [Patescibacteria group bacterium]|nr:succinate--CoA ligase subunit alpha [Patescibacteria group bacterium]
MLLLPKNARLIGQGLTGGQGSNTLPLMLSYGTQIVAGVTPGKGGQKVNGVPIYNSVKEALGVVGEVEGSVQFVPPLFAKAAVFEALDAGLKFVLIGAEKVPTKDAAQIYAYAKKNEASVIGPSSVGIISPSRKLKIGEIGGANPDRVFKDGNIAVISKSGGMTSELGLLLKNHDLGISWAVGIGGDRIISSDFTDFLLELENDEKTKASVIFGELGGTYEEKIAEYVKLGKIKKPVIAFIAGEFTSTLPSDVQFGHAGAIIEGKRGLPSEKRRVLSEAGVKVAENFDEIPNLIKKSI